MLFLGDIACPDTRIKQFIDTINTMDLFKNQIVVANLEGCIIDDPQIRKTNSLYNVSGMKDAFIHSEKVIFSLANNHMYDYPDDIIKTKQFLEDNGIGTFGLFEDDGSIKPYEYTDRSGSTYAFFGHCWSVYTKTNPNDKNEIRVVDCSYNEFYRTVSDYVKQNRNKKVICFMHWNYDMELLPFPMHVELAHDLIDAGVFAVIGNHCHRVQGAEVYRERLIAYCCGNFYIPSSEYFGGVYVCPEVSKDSAVFSAGKTLDISWFRTDEGNQTVAYKSTNEISEDKKLKRLLSFDHYGKDEYYHYFKKNREKKVFVPIFKSYKSCRYRIEEKFACIRIKVVRLIKR